MTQKIKRFQNQAKLSPTQETWMCCAIVLQVHSRTRLSPSTACETLFEFQSVTDDFFLLTKWQRR